MFDSFFGGFAQEPEIDFSQMFFSGMRPGMQVRRQIISNNGEPMVIEQVFMEPQTQRIVLLVPGMESSEPEEKVDEETFKKF